jgi:hypothetical protein
MLFWTTVELEAKLIDFQHYYNGRRTIRAAELTPGCKEVCQSLMGLEHA